MMPSVNSGASCERNESRLKVGDALNVEITESRATSVCSRWLESSASFVRQSDASPDASSLGTLLKDRATAMNEITRKSNFDIVVYCTRGMEAH
eukprot:scaffold112824_cov36-Phaeocystis_antarctica.AAC.1